jgi:signal transduction histidine kinase/ligand-binding sensor domain-containing protein
MLKCFKFLFLNLILLQLFSSSTQSQTIEPKFDKLTIAIPHCILQDINGFIWIGSQEGLIRYDGYDLKKYRNIPYDSTSLSSTWIKTLAEDKAGNLWVGTYGGGLNYFDQRTERFTHFNLVSEEDSTISAKLITKIIANEDGSLWLATMECGLFYAKFDSSGTLKFVHFDLTENPSQNGPEKSIWVLDLYRDDNNCLWIGTKTHGLKKLEIDMRKITHFTHDPNNPYSISHNAVSALCGDSLGNIWIGTGEETLGSGGGLDVYDRASGQFRHFRNDSAGVIPDRIYPLLIDRRGMLWMGSSERGITSISASELLNNDIPNFRHLKQHHLWGIQSIYEDHLGNIWFAQFGRNLYKYDPQQNPVTWYHREKGSSNTMSSSGIECIYIDRLQNIWFGHHNTGMDKYDPKTGLYTNYLPRLNDPSYLNAEWITGVREDESGFFWISTLSHGLYRFYPQKEIFQRCHLSGPGDTDGLDSDLIYLMLLSQTGRLWLSTMDKGLILFDPANNSSRHIDINPNNPGGEKIISMFEDKDGTVWLGTIDDGFYGVKMVNDEIQNVQHYVHNPADRNSLSYNNILDLIRPTVVDTNALWLASGMGVNRYDLLTKSFTHFFEEDGIPHNMVLKVLEDNQGNIWISCAIGIGRYDIRTGQWKNYGISNGLPFETFGGARHNTAKGSDGQLYFSGSSGTLAFFPEKMKDNPIVPPVRLTDFSIYHESIKLDTSIQFKKTITLSHHQNVFTIEFAALNYTNPEKNQYAYKMEGFIDDWIDIGNERQVSFTNLDPGKYIFRVKGSNNHGVWNTEGASIRVIITPPWWQTDWAYFVYTLLLGTLLFGTVRFELQRRQRKLERQLQREQELRKLEEAEHRAIVAELERKTAEARKEAEKEQMRSRIASDLHDEIGSNLSSIALIGQVLQEKLKVSRRMRERLQEIPRISRLTAESMRDIVWFINPENDDWDKFLAKMRETANMMLEIQDFTFSVPEGGITLERDLNFRRNLYLIYKECLQNIIKHSRAQKVEIELRQKDNSLILRVGDDGVGFDSGREYSGNGLKNLRRRAGDIGGKLKIVSEAGQGTTVTLTV